ncbi:DOCK family protein [Dictyostelium discoideum AX4]|uniref:DOCK family protein n=1 Tax=Dictyostelium discoideum TaxID=44689 RepID=Q55EI2_DICDI|nr:DOCK family protein [Dictyostelium discoideum AX4]EAL73033.1 DOCK family protein [Dictyostelium discoideum AX4]|eukprot:XP_647038.1 DOCK family protein [Dictyostelium discoideum AX4]
MSSPDLPPFPPTTTNNNDNSSNSSSGTVPTTFIAGIKSKRSSGSGNNTPTGSPVLSRSALANAVSSNNSSGGGLDSINSLYGNNALTSITQAFAKSESNHSSPLGSPKLPHTNSSNNIQMNKSDNGGNNSNNNNNNNNSNGSSINLNNGDQVGLRAFAKKKKGTAPGTSFLNLKAISDEQMTLLSNGGVGIGVGGVGSINGINNNNNNSLTPTRMKWNDFETEYEKEYENILEPLRFPVGEVVVRRQEKIPRTIFSPTIGIVTSGLEYHVRELIDGFYKDYLIVETKSSMLQSPNQRKPSIKFGGSGSGLGISNSNSCSDLSSSLSSSNGLNGSSGLGISSKLFTAGKQLSSRELNYNSILPSANSYSSASSTPSMTSPNLSSGSGSGSSISISISNSGGGGNSISSNDGSITHRGGGGGNGNRSSTNGTNGSGLQLHQQQHFTDPLKELIPERNGLELLCEVQDLKFSLDVEPFFCSLYIVDLDKKERITESFNFHLNSKSLLDSLKINEDLLSGWSNQKKCKFNLNKYHPNIYFILRVHHIFRGDIEKDMKPYYKDHIKDKKKNDALLAQFKCEISEKCQSWGSSDGNSGQILQPFVWAAYPVFHRPTLSSTPSSMNLTSTPLSPSSLLSAANSSSSSSPSTSADRLPTLSTQNSLNNLSLLGNFNNVSVTENTNTVSMTPPPTPPPPPPPSIQLPPPPPPSMLNQISPIELKQQLIQQINSLALADDQSLPPMPVSPPLNSANRSSVGSDSGDSIITTPPSSSSSSSSSPSSNFTLSPTFNGSGGGVSTLSIPQPPPLPLHLGHRRRSSFMNHQSGSSSSLTSTPIGINTKITNTIEIVNLIPCTPNLTDKTICDMLLVDKDLKKLKSQIPGTFTMSILSKESEEDLRGRISPSLVPLLPVDTNFKKPNLIREIQDFSETPYPFVEYVNNLYIYPENVFIKYKNPNIQIQVQLIDDISCLKSLKCVYPTTSPYIPAGLWDTITLPAPGLPGPSPTTPYPPLDYCAFSCVSFHDKRPHFSDEFKIKLPMKITSQHLLFTFFHINIHAKKDVKTSIGYCAVPLCQLSMGPSGNQGGIHFIKDDYYCAAISSDMNNLSPKFVNPETSKKEKMPVFTFRTKLVSSVITQDPCLDSFFKGGGSNEVKSILKIDRVTCVQFFPSILNQLFQIMCTNANEVASQAFNSILHVIKIVDGFQEKKAGTEKSRLLTYYSEYLFDYVPDSKNLYEELCRQWVNSINSGVYVKDFRLNWFLLDIMTKSMALSLQPTGKLDTDLGRENRFKIEFLENLNKLVLMLIPSQSDGMLVQSWEFFMKFPYFINNLFPLIDRGFLFNLIYNYITRIDPTNEDLTMVTIKFNFLKITTDYDHYIPLNFPMLFKSLDSVSDLNLKFFKRHFLSVLLITEVEGCLKHNKLATRNQAIQTLKQLIKKHHYDQRYQAAEIREKVASIYFPYVLMIVEHYSIIKHQLEAREVQEWLTVFIWILQYCSRDLLRMWFTKETQKHQTNLLNLMMMSLESFKDEPSIFEIAILSIEISKYILDDFNEDQMQSNIILLDIIINILQKCSSISGVEMLRLIYTIFKDYLVPNYPTLLFQNLNNSYCEIITYDLLRSINMTDLLDESASLFYLLLLKNFQSTKDISKMKIQSTVAISRLVGEIKLENSFNLSSFLMKVRKFVTQQENGDSVFINQVEEMLNRIDTLMKYSHTINQNKNDPELVSEMYFRISNSYFESPNLRLTWLENLSKIHSDNENFDEASQCLVHCAYLISRYLIQTNKFNDILESDFLSICPNIKSELLLPTFDQKDSGALFQSNIWSLPYVVELLEKAIEYLMMGNRYELAIEIHSLISKIHKTKKDYKSLSTSLSNCQKVCLELGEKNKETRIYARFYRVGFFGKKFSDEQMDGKEYIYKKPHKCNISVLQNQIKNNLQEKFGQDEEIIVLSNAKVDKNSLDPEKVHIQIVSVDPYIVDPQHQSSAATVDVALSQFDQYFNISQFISEVPFSTEGKAIQDDMSKQQKKKTIFSVELAFPYVKNRLEVVSKREIILSPIENAIELIRGRCIKLKEQLDTNPPRINLLHQILQGSVFPMVNEGPLKICEIFLSPKTINNFNADHVDQLKKAMEKFIIYCGFTLRLSRSIISVQLQEFQNMIEEQYKTLKGQINSYLK